MDRAHFKECPPNETVEKLKSILSSMRIEIDEQDLKVSTIGTYSTRVSFKNTLFGANGKGISKEYCMASAYAELLERFQNDMMYVGCIQKSAKYGFFHAFDEEIMSTADLVSEYNPFMEYYFQHRQMQDVSFTQKVDEINQNERTDYWLYSLDGHYVTVPFYSVKSGRIVKMPYTIYSRYYGSNGMAAGNSPAEAIVQGISEIIERAVSKRIFVEKPCLPDIPDDYLKKFSLIEQLYSNLRKNPNYLYMLKDCSFGGVYPVAALIIVDKNTGRYGIKLGCHPNYGIAIERCFTEAAQGKDVFEYANSSVFDFNNSTVDDDYNIANSYKIGVAQWPYQLFSMDYSYPFKEVEDVSNLTNTDLIQKWSKFFINEGYDLLIRDVSYLGFPSFHIIIPGFSEFQDGGKQCGRAVNSRFYVEDVLKYPEKITRNDVRYIIAVCNYYEHRILENSISDFYRWKSDFYYPGSEISQDMNYLKSMCYVLLGDFASAAAIMFEIYNTSEIYQPKSDQTIFYSVVYHYLSGMAVLETHDKVMAILKNIFNIAICKKVDDIFKEPLSIIAKQYPDYNDRDNKTTSPIVYAYKIREKLCDAQVTSRIGQMNLKKLFD